MLLSQVPTQASPGHTTHTENLGTNFCRSAILYRTHSYNILLYNNILTWLVRISFSREPGSRARDALNIIYSPERGARLGCRSDEPRAPRWCDLLLLPPPPSFFHGDIKYNISYQRSIIYILHSLCTSFFVLPREREREKKKKPRKVFSFERLLLARNNTYQLFKTLVSKKKKIL